MREKRPKLSPWKIRQSAAKGSGYSEPALQLVTRDGFDHVNSLRTVI